MRIAIFDYRVVATNPVGGCHVRLLTGLCHEHDFTIFAPRFENPCSERVTWVRVPAPMRPLALLFVVFHLVAPLVYMLYRLRGGRRFDLIQMVESNLSFGDVDYAHFCHRAYLHSHWPTARPPGVRGVLRWLDHWLHSSVEPHVYKRARHIIVPSRGLARELSTLYPQTRDHIRIIPNPVDLERMRRPADFQAAPLRKQLRIGNEQALLIFVALGQFERKGLSLLLESLGRLDESSRPYLLVVGGEQDLVGAWRARFARVGLDRWVGFVGMQRDVRPYLWSADAFVLPSAYEVFPLVALEAAAAGLPLISTPLNGVEEFLRDGENGLLVERNVPALMGGLRQFLALRDDHRHRLGERARQDVQRYGHERFVSAWREFYASVRAT